MFPTFVQFNSHLTKVHLDEKKFKCPVTKCRQLFSDIETYVSHTKNEHKIKPKFACSKCEQVFLIKSRLSLHEYAHTLKVEEKNPETKKVKNLGLDSHRETDNLNSHNLKVEERNAETKKMTQRYQKDIEKLGGLSLDKHRETDNVFECGSCKMSFPNQNGLNEHMAFVQHDVECPDCHQICVSDTVLQKHLRTHLRMDSSIDRTDVRCNFCDKSFKSQFYLKSHKLIHTGDLPFGCDKCNARFNRKDKLKRHSLIHGTSKKYPCPFRDSELCKKEFYRMDKLKSHIQTHGNNIKRKKCPQCQQGFTNTLMLRKHVADEHREDQSTTKTKIKCFECNETFKLEKQRRIHHEKNHGIVHYMDGTSMKRSLPVLNEELSEIKTSSSHNKTSGSQQNNITIYIEADD